MSEQTLSGEQIPDPAVVRAAAPVRVVVELTGAPGLRFADTASRFVAYLIDLFIPTLPTTIARLVLGRLTAPFNLVSQPKRGWR